MKIKPKNRFFGMKKKRSKKFRFGGITHWVKFDDDRQTNSFFVNL